MATFVPTVPINQVGTTVTDTCTVTALISNTANIYGNVIVTGTTVYANAAALSANTATFGNGITVTTGAIGASSSVLTANSATFVNGLVAGTGNGTVILRGPGGSGATVQILGQTYDPALTTPASTISPAAITFVDNGNFSAAVNIGTKTSGAAGNPLVTRLVVTDTGASFSTNVAIVTGSVASPALMFTGETGTGFYKPATGNVGIAIQGTAALYATANGITAPGNVYLAPGTVAAPALTFTGETGTGWSKPSTGNVTLSVQGSSVLSATSTLVSISKNTFNLGSGFSYTWANGQGSGTSLPALQLGSGFISVNAITNFYNDTVVWGNVVFASLGSSVAASRALITDPNGNIANSVTTLAELSYSSGVTSSIQTQLNARANLASPSFTGTVTLPTTVTLASPTTFTGGYALFSSAVQSGAFSSGSDSTTKYAFIGTTLNLLSGSANAAVFNTNTSALNSNVVVSGNVQASNVYLANGAVGGLALAFTGETNTGLFKAAAGNIAIVGNGTLIAYAANTSSYGTIAVPGNVTAGNVAITKLVSNLALVTGSGNVVTTSVTTLAELANVSGLTRPIQTQLTEKANLASPSFTGTVTLPALSGVPASYALVTSVGNVVANSVTTLAELAYSNGVTSSIQTQLNARANLASPSFTGGVTVTGSSTFGSSTFNSGLSVTGGTIVPSTNTIIQWNGGNPGNMVEVYYSSTDRYGLGQWGTGTLRLYTSYTFGAASICIGKYSNVAGPTTTDWIVCNSGGIYNQNVVTMTANTIVFAGGANTQPIADRSSTFAVYNNAATLNFPSFSGMIMVNNANTGAVSMFLLGGGAVGTLGNSLANPQTGVFTSNATITGYTWTNNSGNNINVSFTAIKTRSAG